jgi:hypothetical protein
VTTAVEQSMWAHLAEMLRQRGEEEDRAEAIEAGPPTWLDPDVTIETFDPEAYLASFAGRLETSAQRSAYTRSDPLLFALLYLARHLKGPDGRTTFADPHLDWFRHALDWMRPPGEPQNWRRAYVAPRSCGKSTFWYLLIPTWAAAHGFTRFIAAFSDSATQAQTHLATLKHELDSNDLLREDYPKLCAPARRPTGTTVADNRALLYTEAGFVFAARGIDSAVLGLKVGERRPDVLLMDDVEDDESSYSAYQAEQRLRTIQDAILMLNDRARVALVGTVTMSGSIVHQLVRSNTDPNPAPWIADENFKTYHYPAIVLNDDGTERSTWPAKWSMEYLASIRHTRSYLKNFANDPLGSDGGYWTADDFRYGTVEGITGQVLSIDPAVTTKKTSDFTGLAIVGFAPARTGEPARCVVEGAWEVRLTGAPLRQHVLGLLNRWPLVRLVLVEVNQGGENWRDILHGLPVKIATVHQTVKKEVRAANVLNHYQRGRVLHATKLIRLEEQMVSFPKAPHDDMTDAVGAAVERLLATPTKHGKAETVYPR